MKNLEILAPIQFERKGAILTGVVDTYENGVFTAVYSNGEAWGGLVLREENNVRVLDSAEDIRRAYNSARVYCTRELKSLASYGDADEYAKQIAEEVRATLARVQEKLATLSAMESEKEETKVQVQNETRNLI